MSKSENKKGSGVIGVVVLAVRRVVDLSVVLVVPFVVVVVVVVDAVDAVFGGNLLRLLKGGAMSLGLFKLAFFAGLNNS